MKGLELECSLDLYADEMNLETVLEDTEEVRGQ